MADQNRKIQLEVGVDASEAKAGLKGIGSAAKEMAKDVQQAGQQASTGVDKVGESTGRMAEKLARQTGAVKSELQRLIAAAESAGQQSKRVEALIDFRGINKNDPEIQNYLARLKQAEAGMNNLGMSAKATAAAMRQVPAQFTDIVVSLQGGQNPLTVLLQQGGQLKDIFGSAGEAARALGGYIAGLVTPLSAGAVAAAALGGAIYQGSRESAEFNKTLILTGNQAGVTSGQLMLMAQSLDAVAGTQGNAAEVLNQLAATGKVAGSVMQEVAQAAIGMERAGGPAAAEMVKAFAELGKDPLQAALKLNQQYGFLTASTYAQIKALEDQGRTTEAATLAQKAFADSLKSRTPEMEKNLGLIDRGWRGIKDAVSEAWDAMKSIGRQDSAETMAASLTDTIAKLEKNIAAKRAGGYDTQQLDAQLAKLKERQGILQSDVRLQKSAAEQQAEQVRLAEAQSKWDKDGVAYLSKKAQMEREITKAINEGNAAKVSQAEIDKRVAAIREKFKETAKKDTFVEGSDAAKEWAQYMKEFGDAAVAATGKTDGLTNSQEKLIKYLGSNAYLNMDEPARQLALEAVYAAISQEQLVEATKKQAKAYEEAAKAAVAYGKQLDDIEMAGMDLIAQANERTQAVQDQIAATEFEATLIGKSNTERAIALKQYQIEVNLKKRIAEINETIAKQEDKDYAINAARVAASKAKANAAAEVVNEEFQRVSQQIENSLTDALMRGFEGGKGFAKNLRDTVANMFKTLVLRPIISAVVNPVAGALTGALGLAGTANAGQGGGSGGFGGFGGLYNSAATSGIGESLGLSYYNGTAMELSGLGSTVGNALPYIGAALAVVSLIKSLDKGGTMHTGGIGGYSAAGGTTTGAATGLRFGIDAKDYNASTEQASAAIAKSIVGILDSTAQTFGQQAGYSAATAFADDSSKDGAWGALAIKLGDKIITDWADSAQVDANVPRVFANGEEGLKQYSAEIGKTVRDVVLGIVPDWADKFFNSLGDNPTLEQVAQAYQQLEQFSMSVVGVSDDTLNGLFKSLIAGEKTAAETGTALADAIVGGVKNSIASAGAQAMTDVAKQYMIMPLVNAIMSGGDLNAALNSIDFDRVGKVMGLLSSGTQELLAKGDWEGFKKAIQGTVQATDDQTKATNDQKDSTLKLSNVLDGTLSATVKAANGLDAVNTALKNLGLSGTVAASAVGAPSASIPGFAVGTNYVPNDMLAMIHQGERIIPAADNRALMDAVGRNVSNAGVITSAFAGVGGSLVTKLDEILQALKDQGVNTGGSSYIQGLQTAKTDFDNTMAAMQEWFGNQGSVVSGQFTDWRFQHGYTGATAPQEALVEFLRNFYPQTAAEFINAAQTYEDAVAKLSAEMEKQSADMLAPLIEQMTGASDPFAVLSKQAQEYIDKLDALGQATAANVGTVEQWLAAMQENTRGDLYSQLLSEEERNALALEKLTGKFTALGVAVPASTEGFRALLDGIDTTTAAGRALYDALVQLVPGFMDLANVANAVNPAAEALTTAQKATDAAMEALRASVAAEQAQINNLLDSARKQSSTIRSVFETLSSAVDDLYGTAAGGMTAASGRALIDQALASGQLPENGELQNAITAIKSSFESAQYASEFEQRKAQLTFAGNLSKLKDAAGEQLSAAEQQVDLLEAQLKALDNQLAAAQEQINALRGIDGGVKTVAEALATLTAALDAESAAKAAIENQAKADKAFVQKLYQDVLHRDADAGGMAYWLGKLGAGIKPTDLIAMFIQASQAELALPQFAAGGDHKGGLRIVGENGPELEATGASRIYSNTQLRDIFSGGQKRDESLVAEIRSLREDNQAQARAMVQMQARMAKLMERWDGNGMPETRVV